MNGRASLGFIILVLLAALPLAAQAPRAERVATESVSANGLAISPRIAYERAMLHISGPQGYAGRRSFTAAEPIQVDLSSFSRRTGDRRSQRVPGPTDLSSRPATPDGRYKYEVVFSVAGRKVGVHTGMFFVERGSAVSRQAKRAQLASLRGELDRSRRQMAASGRSPAPMSTEAPVTEGGTFDDFLAIYPVINPGYSWASVGAYNPAAYSTQAWSMVNSYGYLTFYHGGYPYPLHTIAGYPYPQVTFAPEDGTYGTRIGVGTTIPIETLDIYGADAYWGHLGITGWGGYRSYVAVGGLGTWLYDDDYDPIAVFNHAAQPFSLMVDAEGVGVGDFYYGVPTQDLHVRSDEPQLLVESTSATSAGRTLAYMKNKGDVRMFWENTDSGDVWQMSLLSTVLQMATPTGNGKFRVRKSGGLQALNGSTTILDLDSLGNLEVTTVTETSTREAKTGFETVNGLSVLEKVAALPISEWSYRADSPAVRHLGPMAEDFHAAFGLGRSNKGLTSVDTSGVALAAIQGLNQKLVEKNARIAELEARLQGVEALEVRLQELERLVRSVTQP